MIRHIFYLNIDTKHIINILKLADFKCTQAKYTINDNNSRKNFVLYVIGTNTYDTKIIAKNNVFLF